MYALLLEWLHVTMNNWIASYQFVSFLYTWIKIIFDTGYLLHCSINYCFTRITPAVKHNAKIIFTAPRLFLLPFFIDEDTARKPITQMNNIFNIVPNWLFYGSNVQVNLHWIVLIKEGTNTSTLWPGGCRKPNLGIPNSELGETPLCEVQKSSIMADSNSNLAPKPCHEGVVVTFKTK